MDRVSMKDTDYECATVFLTIKANNHNKRLPRSGNRMRLADALWPVTLGTVCNMA
jgi:hypothetical protein